MILRNRPPISQPIPNPPFTSTLERKETPETSQDKIPQKEVEKEQPKEVKRVRARNDEGEFVADDPTTPENEAWVELPETER